MWSPLELYSHLVLSSCAGACTEIVWQTREELRREFPVLPPAFAPEPLDMETD